MLSRLLTLAIAISGAATAPQAGTKHDAVSAIPGAISTNTTAFLGLWGKGTSFEDQLATLKELVEKYPALEDSISGITVGNEVLYRTDSTASPSPELAKKVKEVLNAVKGSSLENVPVGFTVDAFSA
ncbi:hypothetical protein G3M48_006055 [Beauveria asiatica]|uniref:glucan endo-1,3-beta-D-glucosidase n=1 Tax=Beauveria asiatica TaxID=1069075 RepID=A0AAW0RR20_9HYPO